MCICPSRYSKRDRIFFKTMPAVRPVKNHGHCLRR
jgi:hypothetical protein